MGPHAGLLGKTSIPFTIWLEERMENREDLIIHECTQHHPSELLFNRFLGPSHHILVWKICPPELGFPLTRVRQFTLCVSRARLLDMVPLTTPLQFFGARVVAKGSIFFAECQTHPQIMWLGDFGRLRRYKERMEKAGMLETAHPSYAPLRRRSTAPSPRLRLAFSSARSCGAWGVRASSPAARPAGSATKCVLLKYGPLSFPGIKACLRWG